MIFGDGHGKIGVVIITIQLCQLHGEKICLLHFSLPVIVTATITIIVTVIVTVIIAVTVAVTPAVRAVVTAGWS